MASLGELEKSVMDLLWDSPDPLSAYDLLDRLALDDANRAGLAPTTILTVLSRLEKKGFVERERSSRPHRYSARAGRDAHVAELMHEVLGGASNRTAVLERFVGSVSPEEAAVLRRLLESS